MHLSRRQVLLGASGFAATRPGFASATQPQLMAGSRVLEVQGRAATVFGIDGWQQIDLRFGDRFRIDVQNNLQEPTLIHWHGLTPPSDMDGVPQLSGPIIDPGNSRAFDFDLSRSGTHWMHSHVGLQEQRLLAAPMIVRERAAPLVDEQEHVILLHDFSFREPAEILAELQQGGGMHAGHSMSGAGHDMSKMKMDGMAVLTDIAFDAILANDRTLDDPEVVAAEKAGRFRLRIINGSAATNFWIDLGTLEGQLIAVDGNAIYPVKGKLFPLAIAQRADVRVELPAGSGAWPIIFQAEGSPLRGGVILRTGDGVVSKIGSKGKAGGPIGLELEAKLQSAITLPDDPVSRTEIVMLTGGGSDYVWGLNGKASMHDVLFQVSEGERVDVMFHNMTGMAHPMHLHGHYFKVVNINGTTVDGALRDTVLVPPDNMVTVRFDADNPGTWALHCHHLYHMNSGMMGAIAYKSAA